MIDTPGRCGELDYCSIGQMRTVVRVGAGLPFVCPECGRPLRQVADRSPASPRVKLAVLAGGVLALVALLVWLNQPAPRRHFVLTAANQLHAPVKALPVTAQPAPAKPVSSAPAVSEPAAPVHVAARPPAQAPVAPAAIAPAATASAPAAVPIQPVPPLLPARAAAPAPRVPPPNASAFVPRTGAKVRMDCSIDAAGMPSNCVPIKDTVQPATPPAASAGPAAAPKSPVEPPSAAASRRPAPAKQPPKERDASIVPVAGGEPPYPSDYVRDGRAGEVSVDCLIDEGGEPTRCKVRDVLGGRRFAEATVNWLNSGRIRFAPAMHNGHAVAEERHWHIAFPPR